MGNLSIEFIKRSTQEYVIITSANIVWNIDFNDVNYYSSFHLQKRIGKQYPRLTSLSHGMENFSFPDGYGVPMKGNEFFLTEKKQIFTALLPNIRYFLC